MDCGYVNFVSVNSFRFAKISNMHFPFLYSLESHRYVTVHWTVQREKWEYTGEASYPAKKNPRN